ncbi:MAG: hypothetical protein M3O50_01595 [Myxococcota bacterium]|nr:hypothetical protein [Myxococcota bacterium]
MSLPRSSGPYPGADGDLLELAPGQTPSGLADVMNEGAPFPEGDRLAIHDYLREHAR